MANSPGPERAIRLARVRLASQSIPGRIQRPFPSARGRNAGVLCPQETLVSDSTSPRCQLPASAPPRPATPDFSLGSCFSAGSRLRMISSIPAVLSPARWSYGKGLSASTAPSCFSLPTGTTRGMRSAFVVRTGRGSGSWRRAGPRRPRPWYCATRRALRARPSPCGAFRRRSHAWRGTRS